MGVPQLMTALPVKKTLAALGDALDLADFGIVLLDRGMRVLFANRRFIEAWAVSRTQLTAGPGRRHRRSHADDNTCDTLPLDELRGYVRQREAEDRAGAIASTPIDLQDGRRLLFRCFASADGGHILTCTDITCIRLHEDQAREAGDAAERAQVELRYSKETLEDQASYLASLAEDSDANARRAAEAKCQLEREIAERRQLEAELRRLATTDALTNTLNRRQFFALGLGELARARESEHGLGVLMVDIDHFKLINDRYGHPVGDEALKHLVERLRAGLRRGDLIGRLGGEEFAIILPTVTAGAALNVAERLRAAVAAKPLVHNGVPIPMTISIGLAMAHDTDRTFEQIIVCADAQLYRAKSGGRNRVCHVEQADLREVTVVDSAPPARRSRSLTPRQHRGANREPGGGRMSS